ncbi:MAG: hypothetical protein NT154_15410 [Verrucomicrobia bacterium]|nr:hypothetical protein [Verrucomicrobiota bacterium]
MKFRALLAAAFGLALASAQAATFIVNTTADSGPGSLRQAISDANATPGDDIILFTAAGAISLASALPPITDNTTISGPGTNILTLSGNNSARAFTFNTATTNTISGLTISNTKATGYANGAAIANAGYLTISNCALLANTNLGGWGGAVFNSGAMDIISSSLSGNHVLGENGSGSSYNTSGGGGGAGLGGGVFSMSGRLTITQCTFTANTATGGNGGDAPNGSGNGCGGGSQHGCACATGGYGSGGGGAFANTCPGGNGGFGGGGGGACGQPEPAGAGAGGFGGGGGGTVDYAAGGGGAGVGGGIFVDSGTVTIVDSYFSGNQATGGFGGWGGNKYIDPALNAARAGANGAGLGQDFFTRAANVLPTLTVTTLGGGQVVPYPQTPPYLSNSWARLTATPAPGWQFLYWLGDANGTNPTTPVKVTRTKYAQAIFGTTLTPPALTSIAPQADFYPYGTTVRLTALPPLGTSFASWGGDISGTNNPATLTVTNPTQSVAYNLGALGPGQVALTIVENGQGQIAANPRANTYTNGQAVALVPTPDLGQNFIGWSGDATGTQNPLIVPMTQTKVITANFTKRPSLRAGTPLEGLVEDGFRLTLTGEFGTNYAILGSTNLTDWTPIGVVTNTYGTVQLTDPAATNLSHRSYRAVSQ